MREQREQEAAMERAIPDIQGGGQTGQDATADLESMIAQAEKDLGPGGEPEAIN